MPKLMVLRRPGIRLPRGVGHAGARWHDLVWMDSIVGMPGCTELVRWHSMTDPGDP